MNASFIRLDHRVICQMVNPEAKILDLGCGDGELMYQLANEKSAKVQGIELDEKSIYKCVEKGLSVFHGDIDSGLTEYPDKSFDYVILNQSLQQVKKVEFVLQEALRVGDKVIVGFPNFASLNARSCLFFKGKAPVSSSLPYRWYDTPNTHFLSVRDFKEYCAEKGLHIISAYYLGKNKFVPFMRNLFALDAVFLITKS